MRLPPRLPRPRPRLLRPRADAPSTDVVHEVAGAFTGGTGLGNGGDTIALTLGATTLRSFTYDDTAPWPTAPDGHGPSLVLKSPTTNPDHSLATNWIASADRGGTPAQSPAQMTFAAWRAAYSDALVAMSDNDGDGIPNALEYALLLNPLVANQGALPSAELVDVNGQNHLAITFRYRPASDLTIEVQTSNMLGAWVTVPNVTLVSSIDHGDGSLTQTWRCSTGVPGLARQFLRVRAVVTP